jgi:hypothetical protein
MAQTQSSPAGLTGAISGPICQKCKAPMAMAPMIPGLGMFAHRIFECSRCKHLQLVPET